MKYKHYVANYILNPPHELSVAVIGCGGTGSQVLTSLGRMNYALKQLGHPGLRVVAYDADVVTAANCGRQLFSEQEIGHNKAECLITKLNMYFGTQWDSRAEMYTEKSVGANIIISCVDTISSRLAIKKALESTRYNQEKNYYWLDFGNTQETGQVILGTSGQNIAQPKRKRNCVGILPCVTDEFDFSKAKDKDSGPSCSLAEALNRQDLFVNSALAQIGMALLWKMFTKGILEYRGAYMNLGTMKVNPIRIEKHEKYVTQHH